jgi:hypothetical protein
VSFFSGEVNLETLQLSCHDRRILERLHLKKERERTAEEMVSSFHIHPISGEVLNFGERKFRVTCWLEFKKFTLS